MRVALAVLIALAAAAAATASPPRHAKVLLRTTSLGHVLADARGRTVYLFSADSAAMSACYGQCAAVWPPLLTSRAAVEAVGVRKGLLSTITRKDGTLQVAYAGHPLYRFSADARAGQTNGEGIVHFGGSWYAVGAGGRAIEPAASASYAGPATPGSDMGDYP